MIEAANTSGGSPVAAPDDGSVIEALRRGDKIAFAHLVDHYPASLRRGARLYISNRAVADEVVQDTWLGVIQGMWAFEGRSSLETWIFRILIKSVGGINALHPRSPTACVPPPAVHPHLRTLDSRWSRRHSAHDQPPRAPATPPRLSGCYAGTLRPSTGTGSTSPRQDRHQREHACLSKVWRVCGSATNRAVTRAINRTQELWQRLLRRLAAAPANPFEGRQSSTREGKP